MSADPFDHVRRRHLAIGAISLDSQCCGPRRRVELDQRDLSILDVQQRANREQGVANPIVDLPVCARTSREDHASTSAADPDPFETNARAAEITRSRTSSIEPGINAPAAFACPPPPN